MYKNINKNLDIKLKNLENEENLKKCNIGEKNKKRYFFVSFFTFESDNEKGIGIGSSAYITDNNSFVSMDFVIEDLKSRGSKKPIILNVLELNEKDYNDFYSKK